MKYGIEIEFQGFTSIDYLSEKIYNLGIIITRINDYDLWQIGTDSSMEVSHGYELRTPKFEFFPFDEFKKILSVLCRFGRTVEKAGLHIHFSGQEIDFWTMHKTIRSMKMSRKARKEWCGNRNGSEYDKYQCLRKIRDDHYEVRVFNSTFNLRAIHQNWTTVVKLIEKHKR